MTSLLRDLALEKEDFSTQHQQETLIVDGNDDSIDYKDKYNTLLSTHEQLEVTHHKTLGEVTILKDTINTLQEDFNEAKKHIERQKEQEVEFQEVEEENADLREECEKHVLALKELQACHADLEHSLSDSNGQIHTMQMGKKTLLENIKHKDEVIAKLEKELCDMDKLKHSNSQIVRSLSTFGGSDGSAEDSTSTPTGTETKTSEEIEEATNITTNPNELSLSEQVNDLKECARRSSSRLSYLNTRLGTKDDMIVKLQNRIEEVITERDSFREALQMSFVSSEPDICSSQGAVIRSTSDSAISSSIATNGSGGPSSSPVVSVSHNDGDSEQDDSGKKKTLSVNIPSPSSQERRKADLSMGTTETKSSPPSIQTHRKTKSESSSPSTSTSVPAIVPPPGGTATSPSGSSASVLGNWQSAVAGATGLTTDGLKGVTSSLLSSYLYAPGSSESGDKAAGAGLSNASGLSHHHKQYITNLEKKIQLLQEKNKKMSELKSLIPVVEELKEKVQTAEEASKETDKWADEEFTILSKNMDEMRALRKEAVAKYQHSQQEVEDLKQQISRTANTYANFEDKLQEKVRRVQIMEQDLKRTKENSVDVGTYREAEDRISALMGESKHWQQKAQSLSKEMHRSMTLQMDYNKKKDEILKLEKKIEELEVERLSFKEAMQEMMLDQSRAEQEQQALASTQQHETPQKKAGSLAKSWLGNIL